ncbi:unnamed protein product [Peniophora sp. CBMAI 1063]|nr:unnamed protein product [Peniophora sp. CBMAI 1063]
MISSTPDEISNAYARIQSTFTSGKTRPLAWRRQQLVQIGKLVQENEEMLLSAISVDLGKPRVEVMVADMGPVVSFVVEALEKLEEWAAPESVDDVPAWQASWAPRGERRRRRRWIRRSRGS